MKSLDRVLQGSFYEHGSEEHLDGGTGNQGGTSNNQSEQNFPYLDPNPTISNYYPTTNFSNKDRYDDDAPYNQAPEFNVPQGIGLPLTYNFDYDDFIKTTKGNNRETFDEGYDLPLYVTLPKISRDDSFQWDSFPAGEAQQFLVFSVDSETINSRSPLNGETGETVVLEAQSSSKTKRPYTISLTVTPYNAGPIPHIHWAEDEAFIMLQGEMDSWIGDPGDNPYELYEFPEGNDIDGDNFPPKENTKQLSANNVEHFYYGHLMAEDGVFLPRGHAHAYRNASPNGDPLVFLTLWSRTPGYPDGGIEEFFTLSEPTIGRFYDNANDAASYGNLYNKNIGSDEAISNQQRFVDYFNTFPEYYVAMSRNFGSFTGVKSDSVTNGDGSALTMGGNWNPMIPTDTGTFPTPPPAAWDEASDTPWLATPGEEGVDDYYTAPAPNSPSKAVNFSTPFDPQIIQRIEITYNKSNKKGITRKEYKENVVELASLLGSSEGIESSDLLKPKSTEANTEILNVWEHYSSLSDLQKSQEFKSIYKRIKKSGNVEVTNSSVDVDLASNYESSAPEQMLLGKFDIKDGSKEKVLKISEKLKQKTNEESGNISFDYYLEKNNSNTIYFIEHYSSGSHIASHLQKSYTAKFFQEFAPLLETGDLADGDVSIYPVNTPESQVYADQENGIELFTDLLESMPEMDMTLAIQEGIDLQTIYVSNKSDSKGYGSFLEFTPTQTDLESWTYGLITVDNEDGDINEISIGNTEAPDQNWLNEAASRTRILFETSATATDSQKYSRNLQVNSKTHYLPFRTESDADLIINNNQLSSDINFDFSNGSQVQLDEANESFIFEGIIGSYGTVIQGMSTVTSALQEKGSNIIDTSHQPRRTLHGTINHTGSNDIKSDIGLIITNSTGDIYDSQTGNFHSITSEAGQSTLASMEANGDLTYMDPHFEIKGGNLFTPVIKKDGKYYTFANTESSILGANAFEMVVNEVADQFSIEFTHSEQMPLLS